MDAEDDALRRHNAPATRRPVLEQIVTDATESFLWRCDDYPWARNVWNIHPEYEIHLVRNASGIALVGDHIEPFEPGYLAIVGSGLPHDWVSATAPGEIIRGRDIVLQFDRERLRAAAGLFPELAALEPFLALALRGLSFHGETRRLGAAQLEAMRDARGLERLGLFLRLLGTLAARGEYKVLSSEDFMPDTDDASQSSIHVALTHIRENFTRDLALAELAGLLCMSEWAFSRFFKKNSGSSFTDYLRSLRVAYACKLLADTAMPITDICFEIGYANVSNFNRNFLRQRGMTPSSYRRMSQQRMTRSKAAAVLTDTVVQPSTA
jgi:AraC-like DNA-binding protein